MLRFPTMRLTDENAELDDRVRERFDTGRNRPRTRASVVDAHVSPGHGAIDRRTPAA